MRMVALAAAFGPLALAACSPALLDAFPFLGRPTPGTNAHPRPLASSYFPVLAPSVLTIGATFSLSGAIPACCFSEARLEVSDNTIFQAWGTLNPILIATQSLDASGDYAFTQTLQPTYGSGLEALHLTDCQAIRQEQPKLQVEWGDKHGGGNIGSLIKLTSCQ